MRLLVFLPEEFQCKQKVQKKIREQVPTKSSRIKQLRHSTHKTTRLLITCFILLALWRAILLSYLLAGIIDY